MAEDQSQGDSGVAVKEKQKVKRPTMYQVMLHNDDYTTMEFVIFVLKKFFKKDDAAAQQIMLKVHHEGLGVCGVYTKEIAEMKVQSVNSYSKKKGHPLKSSCEPCE